MSLIAENTHVRTDFALDQTLVGSLLAKSGYAERISMLVELLSVAVDNPRQFDKLERMSKAPLLSFAEVCIQMPKLSTSHRGQTPRRPTKTPASSSTTPCNAPSRRSTRVARRVERALSQPLVDFIPAGGKSACDVQVKDVRKRKRTPNHIDEHSGRHQGIEGLVDRFVEPPAKRICLSTTS